ncbi:hypothetical protein [Pseudomonas helleri]|uniref:hypothetical protein n=1 Tax=Pseudomonas helleri TaxID=1608996 RepID=UPI00242C7474|nr:hypothetical protein [Pseudomonas helleri]
MSPTLTIILLITGWLAVAAAMLWGLMRISRHHPQPQPEPKQKPAQPAATTANAH